MSEDPGTGSTATRARPRSEGAVDDPLDRPAAPSAPGDAARASTWGGDPPDDAPGDPSGWDEEDQYDVAQKVDRRDHHEHDHEHPRDIVARLYVGLWLPGAGALLTYAVMARNYWAAFVGVELLLVGWFGLGKL